MAVLTATGAIETRPTAARPLERLFSFSLALSLGMWSYAVATTAVDSFDSELLAPMFTQMPVAFWAGWGTLLLATIAWYFSEEARGHYLLLAVAWTLFLFIGPELMQVNARGEDTFGHLVGITFYDQGRYRFPEVSYSAFPGFHFIAIALSKITGVEYYGLAKLLAEAFHIVRLAAIWYLGSQLFSDRKQALFFTLLLLALCWDNQQFDPSNQNLGITFLLFVLAALLAQGSVTWERRLLLLIFYGAAVITHPLTTMVLIMLALFFVLVGLTGKRLAYNNGMMTPYSVALLAIGFITWVLYTADWVLPEATRRLLTFLRVEHTTFVADVASSPQNPDPYTPYTLLVYGFLALLLVWGLIVATKKEFRSRLGLQTVFPILSIFPSLPPLFVGLWTLRRWFLFGAPFIAWFLAREMPVRRNLALPFLLVLLTYFFALRYYAEYFDYNPSAYIYGSQFVAEKIPPSASIYRGHRASAPLHGLANAIDVPCVVDNMDLAVYALRPGIDFRYGLDSEREKETVVFRIGEERWEWIREVLSAYEQGIIYSSGELRVRAYQQDPGEPPVPCVATAGPVIGR